MQNVKMSVDGAILTITIDLSQDCELGKKWNYITVATSRGFQTIPGANSEKINLHVYRPKNNR